MVITVIILLIKVTSYLILDTNNPPNGWNFASAKANNIQEILTGYFSKYDGSGYTKDFTGSSLYNDPSTIADEIDNTFTAMSNTNQYPSIRAFIMTYSIYNKPMDLLVSVNIVCVK